MELSREDMREEVERGVSEIGSKKVKRWERM